MPPFLNFRVSHSPCPVPAPRKRQSLLLLLPPLLTQVGFLCFFLLTKTAFQAGEIQVLTSYVCLGGYLVTSLSCPCRMSFPSTAVGQGLADHGPRAKSGWLPAFVNKVLLAHAHPHLFLPALPTFLLGGESSSCKGQSGPQSLKYLLFDLL